MSKPSTKLYTVHYNDGTYLSYNFTRKDYSNIALAMMNASVAVVTDVGILRVSEIRSVILQRVKADVPQHQGYSPDMSKESLEWMKAAKLSEQLLIETDEDLDGEVDYDGGLIS